MMAVVDVETTGLQPGYHSVVQVCVLPLNSDFEPFPDCVPFYMDIQPIRRNVDWKAMSITKLEYNDILERGMPETKAAELFDEWFEKLNLPHNKSLTPLAHNWPFDYSFMVDWLGWHNMNRYFHGHYRDLMCAGLYENDKAAFNIRPYPYPKHGLAYYCSQLKIKNDRAHDALQDCVATAKCYRQVVKAGMFTTVGPQPESIPNEPEFPRTLRSVSGEHPAVLDDNSRPGASGQGSGLPSTVRESGGGDASRDRSVYHERRRAFWNPSLRQQ